MVKPEVTELWEVTDVAMSLILHDFGYRSYVQIKSFDDEWVEIVLYERTSDNRKTDLRIHRTSTLWSTIRHGKRLGSFPITENS